MNWIPIENKLPSEYHEVLVSMKCGGIVGFACAYIRQGKWLDTGTHGAIELDGFTVTHWCELQQPQKRLPFPVVADAKKLRR